jgi:hypothetical protein
VVKVGKSITGQFACHNIRKCFSLPARDYTSAAATTAHDDVELIGQGADAVRVRCGHVGAYSDQRQLFEKFLVESEV